MATVLPNKDPDNVEPYFVIWCDIATGLNDGSKHDHGELQGSVISSAQDAVQWIMPSDDPPELIKVRSNQDAVTIAGVDYDVNTVCTIWLSGGVHNKDYLLICRVRLDDTRILDKSIIIPVRDS